MRKQKRVYYDAFRSVRLTGEQADKVERLSALAGKPGDFSHAVRWLIDVAPEPRDLAAQAMAQRN